MLRTDVCATPPQLVVASDTTTVDLVRGTNT